MPTLASLPLTRGPEWDEEPTVPARLWPITLAALSDSGHERGISGRVADILASGDSTRARALAYWLPGGFDHVPLGHLVG